jgi:hypothetical protein
MGCSNCGQDNQWMTTNGSHSFCPACRVSYGKNRSGFSFMPNMEVYIDNFHPKTDGRIFIVKDMFKCSPGCESGVMVLLMDKETGRQMKSFLDVNWLKLPELVN